MNLLKTLPDTRFQVKTSRNIFLLGATGFVGSRLLQSFSSDGENVIQLNPRESDDDLCENILQSHLVIDEEDICVVAAAAGVNTNGLTESDFHFNARALPEKVKFLSQLGITKFIFLGSCFEYGLTGNFSESLESSSELLPTEPYGLSKKDGYLRLMDWASNAQVSLSYIRLFQVFGGGEAEHRLYTGLVRAGKMNIDYLLKDPHAVRDFCNVSSVVNAVKIHSFGLTGLKTLNLCTGVPRSLMEFSLLVLKSMGSTSTIETSNPAQEGVYRRLVGVPDIKIPFLL